MIAMIDLHEDFLFVDCNVPPTQTPKQVRRQKNRHAQLAAKATVNAARTQSKLPLPLQTRFRLSKDASGIDMRVGLPTNIDDQAAHILTHGTCVKVGKPRMPASSWK